MYADTCPGIWGRRPGPLLHNPLCTRVSELGCVHFATTGAQFILHFTSQKRVLRSPSILPHNNGCSIIYPFKFATTGARFFLHLTPQQWVISSYSTFIRTNGCSIIPPLFLAPTGASMWPMWPLHGHVAHVGHEAAHRIME